MRPYVLKYRCQTACFTVLVVDVIFIIDRPLLHQHSKFHNRTFKRLFSGVMNLFILLSHLYIFSRRRKADDVSVEQILPVERKNKKYTIFEVTF